MLDKKKFKRNEMGKFNVLETWGTIHQYQENNT